MRVVKHCEDGIVRRVVLVDDRGNGVVPVCRFLSHLADSGYSPNTLCAYAYDLRRLFKFCDDHAMAWTEFRAATTFEYLGYLRRIVSRGPAQQLGLAATVAQGRCLSAATIARILAATSSFYEWAIAVELYGGAENPMQKRDDPALARVLDRHRPFAGHASRQRPIRRAVRVRLPIRLPRPLSGEDIEALMADMTSLRDLAIFLLMLDGGLRPGEVLCLRLADISYGRRWVTIRKRDDHPRGARAKSRRERVADPLPLRLRPRQRSGRREHPMDRPGLALERLGAGRQQGQRLRRPPRRRPLCGRGRPQTVPEGAGGHVARARSRPQRRRGPRHGASPRSADHARKPGHRET